MNFDVRGAVIHNIQHMSEQELTDMVNEKDSKSSITLVKGSFFGMEVKLLSLPQFLALDSK